MKCQDKNCCACVNSADCDNRSKPKVDEIEFAEEVKIDWVEDEQQLTIQGAKDHLAFCQNQE